MGIWEVSTWDMMGFYLSSISTWRFLSKWFSLQKFVCLLKLETWNDSRGPPRRLQWHRMGFFQQDLRMRPCAWHSHGSFLTPNWKKVQFSTARLVPCLPNLPSWSHGDAGSPSSFPCFQRYGENPKVPRGDCHSTDDFIATSHFWPQFSDTPLLTDESPLVRINRTIFPLRIPIGWANPIILPSNRHYSWAQYNFFQD